MYSALKEFGLSENEITTYTALLQTGTTTANRVAKITGIKRSTTYDNLSLLISKGIVASFQKENVHFYEPATPETIVKLMEEKKERVEAILPSLQKIANTSKEKTGVTFYEGKKGVLTILNDILAEGKELWFYGSRKQALHALQHFPENFIVKRAEANIPLKAVLAEEDKNDPAFTPKHIAKLSSLSYNKALNGVMTNVFIYGEKVAFMTSSPTPVGIIIKNKALVEQQKTIFQQL